MDIISIGFNIIMVAIGAVLSVYLGKLLKQNGKVLEKMDEGFRMIARLTVEENEKTRKTLLEQLGGRSPPV